jgi:GTP pyrophosphokinase
MSIDSRDGVFDGTFHVFVHDREELDLLCQRLAALNGISNVERLETNLE